MDNKTNEKQFVKDITDISVDFPQWYTDVVLKTQLVDYGPVKGTMVIRPYGYAIWENIQNELNKRFKAVGVQNAYFPMFIPESYLKREAEHVEGFAPEVAVVTYAGGQELQEKLVVRPTSETIICNMFSKWMQSYRDLPIKMNQWCNVVRWEKTTRPFLRTSEFLWQEGHTAHSTEEEAMDMTFKMLNIYKEFAENCLAIPVLTGKKTQREKFAGAVATYGMEAMMHDGKSLQAGTSHYLGQNFAKSFDMQFLSKEGKLQYAYSSSWGVSTRLIGAIIMTHGDNRGLILPPVVAPTQVVIVPIAAHKEGVVEKATQLEQTLAQMGVRVTTDTRDMSPGWKFNEWEMKGVPLRLEIGPRDIENNQCVLVRRDTGEKQVLSLDNLSFVKQLLDIIQVDMLNKAREHRDSRIKEATSIEQIKTCCDNGNFAKVCWCGEEECEVKVKEYAQATSRVMIDDENCDGEVCAICGKPAKKKVYFARAY